MLILLARLSYCWPPGTGAAPPLCAATEDPIGEHLRYCSTGMFKMHLMSARAAIETLYRGV